MAKLTLMAIVTQLEAQAREHPAPPEKPALTPAEATLAVEVLKEVRKAVHTLLLRELNGLRGFRVIPMTGPWGAVAVLHKLRDSGSEAVAWVGVNYEPQLLVGEGALTQLHVYLVGQSGREVDIPFTMGASFPVGLRRTLNAFRAALARWICEKRLNS